MAELTFTLILNGLSLLIDSDGDYRLLSHSGIEAADYDVVMVDNAILDGGYVQSERIRARSISIEFMISDMTQAETLRAALISFFKPKLTGTLYVSRGGVTRRIYCKLASRPEFSQQHINVDPLRVTINLICPQPYFLDELDTTVRHLVFIPTLNFPLTFFPGGGLTVGMQIVSDTTVINNTGDTDIGIICGITANKGAIINPKISIDSVNYVRIITVLDVGDTLEINTRTGEKDVKLNGVSDFLYDITSVFFAVPPGEHTITITADTGAANAASSYTYALKYLGV
jgi:hypothetical protein